MFENKILQKRLKDRDTFKDIINTKHWTANERSFAWEDVIKNILEKRPIYDLSQPTCDKDYTFTITLRGTYSTGRNSLLKEMFIIDEDAYCLRDVDKKYIFLILPMFKVIIPGYYQEYFNPLNYIDMRSVHEYSIAKWLELISEIYETPELKGYNFIYDGNKFLGYTNRMKLHAKEHGRNYYFDLYILDGKSYDYLNTPIDRCHYSKFGWNKYPKLWKEMCPIDDCLLTSLQNDITTYALINKNPLDMVVKLLYGELLNIRHYRTKPIIQ